ncbi:MAG: MogA/MoaB family molybdenum cofactor biosynthesis protein [Desulfobacterales bacterium]|nr:MogA/MoaB family molybdenum cofactor biosynthesis protein [Desulfobacterales bacterium]
MSDKGSQGKRRDSSGPAIVEMLEATGLAVIATAIVPDREETIRETLVQWVDHLGLDLVVTTGGTGVAVSDVTPEATRKVLDREVPGISEAMRGASLQKTPHAMLSRGLAGIRKTCLIINLPGSERAARENLAVVLAALPHALAKIRGDEADCGG